MSRNIRKKISFVLATVTIAQSVCVMAIDNTQAINPTVEVEIGQVETTTPSAIEVDLSEKKGETKQLIIQGNLVYEITDAVQKTVAAAGVADPGKTVTQLPEKITHNGDDYIVTSIGNRAFEYLDTIGFTSLPDTITSIGEEAFKECKNLKLTKLPANLEYVGPRAFYECNNKDMNITQLPDSLTSIGDEAFTDCLGIKLTSLPANLESIGDKAFYNCSNLKVTSLPESLKEIGKYAFYRCTSLAITKVPSGITDILEGTFGATGITTMELTDNIQTIGKGAFAECEELTSILLPSTLTKLSDGIFYECFKLTQVNLPPNLETIGIGSFRECMALKKVEVPETVTEIGDMAFEACVSLTDINIPQGITTINEAVFSNCWALPKIEIPDGVTEIGASAFEECRSLTDITIPDGVEIISDATFKNCVMLPSIEIPSGVTEIGDAAFEGCESLPEISIPQGVTTISDNVFKNCLNLTDVEIPSDVTEIGASAFEGCKKLPSIEIPSGVKTIGSAAFKLCVALPEIIIPEGVTSIKEATFADCTALEEVNILGAVTEIGDEAFMGCSALPKIDMPSSVETIGTSAFENCSKLALSKLPTELASLGESVFEGCDTIKLLEVGSKLKTVGYEAIPENIKVIAQSSGDAKDLKDTDGLENHPNVFYYWDGSEDLVAGANAMMQGDVTIQVDVTVPQGATLLVEDGQKLTIPESRNMTIDAGATLQNEGTLELDGTLVGAGTLKGEGIFNKGTVTIDDIEPIEEQFYTGEAIRPAVIFKESIIMGKEFAVDTEGWGSAIEYVDNINVGQAKIVLTNGGRKVEIPFQIYKTGIALEEGMVFYKDDVQTDEFVYGDTITVKVIPQVSMELFGMETPTPNQMALFVDDVQITPAQDVTIGKELTFTYDTTKQLIPLSDVTITARYQESDNTYEGNWDGELTLNKADLQIEVEDKRMVVGEALPPLTWRATGLATGETVAEVKIDTQHIDTETQGNYDLIATDVVLENGNLENYEITYKKGQLIVGINIDGLLEIIEKAEALNNQVKVIDGKDASEIIENIQYVTSDAKEKFETAITQAIDAKDTIISKGDLEAAIEQLKSAIDAFVEGIQEGTYVATTVAQEAMNHVQEVQKGILVSDKEASEIEAGTRYVNTQEKNQLDEALATFKTIQESATTKDEITAAVEQLNDAIKAFEDAIKVGTKKDNSGSNNGGSSNSGSSTTSPNKPVTNTIITTKPQGDNHVASLNEDLIKKAILKAQENSNNTDKRLEVIVQVDVNDKDAKSIKVQMPLAAQKELLMKGSSIERFVIEQPELKIGFDMVAISTMNKVANDNISINTVRINVGDVVEDGNKNIDSLYDISVAYANGTKTINDLETGMVTIEIPYVLKANEKPENIYAVMVDKDGKTIEVKGSMYDKEKQAVIFTVNELGMYGVAHKETQKDEATNTSKVKFDDINGHWAENSINYIAELGILGGTSEGKFSPDTTLTRGMFVVAMGRLAGIDGASYENSSYSDVRATDYYMPYIEWATEKGIVKGIGSGKFAPNQAVTREQMAAILVRFANKMEVVLSTVEEEKAFADDEKIGNWSKESVAIAQQTKLMVGKANNKFDPQGHTTRAEAAAVLSRFIETVK